MGVWGKTWNRAVVFGAGGFRGFPSGFPDWSPAVWYSRSRAVEFLTSPRVPLGRG
jgi:hypothetical protein